MLDAGWKCRKGAVNDLSNEASNEPFSESANELYLPHGWVDDSWWSAYRQLDTALTVAGKSGAIDGGAATAIPEVVGAYAHLTRELVRAGYRDLAAAIAFGLVVGESPLAGGRLPSGPSDLQAGEHGLLEHDLATLSTAARRDLSREVSAALALDLPDAKQLAPPEAGSGVVSGLREALLTAPAAGLLEAYLEVLRRAGGGPAALFPALRWHRGRLEGVPAPAPAHLEELVGLDEQLARLTANTEALLAGRGAQNALLYGPRGSGKSTAVRGLLERYAAAGLRLVELPLEEVGDLAELLSSLAGRPQAFVLFVDDLSFEDGDSGYRPLRTLLEGGLAGRPPNIALYATSNRRHLLKERFSQRPDPLDDDVHRWDTQHERLALADRFGLVITFPDAGQRRYLEVVRGLARHRGLEHRELDEAAIRFAEWGNGYSGRTAAQFIESLRHHG